MSETMTEISGFFDLATIDPANFERFNDLIHSSSRNRDTFLELIADRRGKARAGSPDALKVGAALLITGQYIDALEMLAKAPDDGARRYYAGMAALYLNRLDEAQAEFTAAGKNGWDPVDADLRAATALIRKGDVGPAEKLINKHEAAGQNRADWHHVRGLLFERRDERETALENFDQAMAIDPYYVDAMFRAAWLYDLHGQDQMAVDIYERLSQMPAAHVNALINLAVLHEDNGDFDQALQCLQRVLNSHPNHHRARLYYKDVESSRLMVIDEYRDRRTEKRNKVLEQTISDFELSMRARNVLKKMKIGTLGELIKLTEAELLAYKNFGETTLNEIKALLSKRGLRLGMRPDEVEVTAMPVEAPAPKPVVPAGNEAVLNKLVSDLELSVRSRRCLQRLNVNTLGELVQYAESDLLAIRNFGLTSLNEIKARLAENGLGLAPKK